MPFYLQQFMSSKINAIGICLCLGLSYGLVVFTPTIVLADDNFKPTFTPSLNATRATTEIKIDGHLDESAWRLAGQATNFTERDPGDNIQPLVETKAFITYDDDNLYIGFICYDDPEKIRATMCQRDTYFDDDAVGIKIDTFGEAQWAYELWVNPYGIQKDLMWSNIQGTDRGFDMIWHSAAQFTDDGYVVEMAIPFKSLRFPDADVQTWKFDFCRSHPRESFHQYTWAAQDRNEQCFVCQWGTVNGIKGVKPGKGFELLPSFIAFQRAEISDVTNADSDVNSHDPEGEFSLGAKYSISSAVTLDASVNPDFSQIESDAAQIDVNSPVVRFYPERRPFFQEGSDLFRTMFNSFYTRTVNNPEVAAKGTARWEKTSLAYMFARDENSPYTIPTEERGFSAAPGKSSVHVLRGLQSLGNNSQAGFMITDRRYDVGGSGTILSGDVNIRLTNTTRWVAQYVRSFTEEPENIAVREGATFDHGKHTVDLDGESYQGNALITQLRMNSEKLRVTLDFNQTSPTYQTQTGYDPWNNQRNSFIYAEYRHRPESGLIQQITPSMFTNARWNMDSTRKWLHMSGSVNVNLRWAQTRLGLGYETGTETWRGTEFEDLWSVNGNFSFRPTEWLGGFAFGQIGEQPALGPLVLGDEVSYSLNFDIKPLNNLIIEPTYDYSRSQLQDGTLLFKQSIARARIRWQISPRLSIRMVVQHNSSRNPEHKADAVAGNNDYYHMYLGSKWEFDPLLTYRVNSFSVFYLGSTHDYRDFNSAFDERSANHVLTERQYFMKLQYLFQL